MHISHQGTFYHISLITGPTHTTRLVEFAPADVALLPSVEALPPVGRCDHGHLDADVVLASVLAGVEDANQKWHRHYRVAHSKYVPNDTPRTAIYKVLGYALVAHLEQGGLSSAQ